MARRTHKITRQDIERAVRTLSRPGTPREIEALVREHEGKHYAGFPYELESFIVGDLNRMRGWGDWVGTGFGEQGLGAGPRARRAEPSDVFSFKMTNLPGDPWREYYVLKVDDDGTVTFSSLPPGSMQYQAEHFRETLEDLAADAEAGLVLGPSDRRRLVGKLAGMMEAAGWGRETAQMELRRWAEQGFESLTETPLAAVTEALAEVGV